MTSSGERLVRTAIDMSSAQERVRNLGKRIIELSAHLGLIVAGQAPLPDVTHDARHPRGVRAIASRRERAAASRDPDVLPHRILAAKGALCQDIVYHHDVLGAHAIAVVD